MELANKFRNATAGLTEYADVDLTGGDFNVSSLNLADGQGVYIADAQGTDTATIDIIPLKQSTEASFEVSRISPNLYNTIIRTIKAGSGTTAINIKVGW